MFDKEDETDFEIVNRMSFVNALNSKAIEIVDTIHNDLNMAVDKILNVYKSSA